LRPWPKHAPAPDTQHELDDPTGMRAIGVAEAPDTAHGSPASGRVGTVWTRRDSRISDQCNGSTPHRKATPSRHIGYFADARRRPRLNSFSIRGIYCQRCN
jgi:hypothetical protein